MTSTTAFVLAVSGLLFSCGGLVQALRGESTATTSLLVGGFFAVLALVLNRTEDD